MYFTVYTKVYGISRTKKLNIKQNFYEISEKLIRGFFSQLNINVKNSSSRVHSKQKAWKTVSNIQNINKIRREMKQNLYRFTIKIRNYYFLLLFVVQNLFFNLIIFWLRWLLKFILKVLVHFRILKKSIFFLDFSTPYTFKNLRLKYF